MTHPEPSHENSCGWSTVPVNNMVGPGLGTTVVVGVSVGLPVGAGVVGLPVGLPVGVSVNVGLGMGFGVGSSSLRVRVNLADTSGVQTFTAEVESSSMMTAASVLDT